MLSLNLINRSVISTCRCAAISNNIYQVKVRNVVSKSIDSIDKREAKMRELKLNFEPIYRFPIINGLAALSNIKSYQGVITLVGLPVTYIFYPEYLFEFAYSGITLGIVLCLTSLIFRNTIGAVYIHKKETDLVRIAYIDFWGRRNDSEININDIIPFSQQTKRGIGDRIFSKVKFINEKHVELKFISKNSIVLDNEKFSQVFGEY